MKKIRMLATIFPGLFFCSLNMAAQDPTGKPDETETYIRQNIVFTKFRMLGVDERQYAKCVESVNYLDADKRLKSVLIDDVEYLDDGKKYDLVENDGILTSTNVFQYEPKLPYLSPGVYKDSNEDVVVYDDEFLHMGEVQSKSIFSIGINCRFKWVKCSQMTGIRREICYQMGWPWGEFQLIECGVGISISF